MVYATHQPKTFFRFSFYLVHSFSLCFFERTREKWFSIRFLNNLFEATRYPKVYATRYPKVYATRCRKVYATRCRKVYATRYPMVYATR